MSNYLYNATERIVETFESKDIKFRVESRGGQEEVQAGFPVENGPVVMMKFISRDNDNDVAARIFGLANGIPGKKRARVLEACNILHNRIRFLRFCVDSDGNLDVEYDFPVASGNDCIGGMVFEIFARTMNILDQNFEVISKALYTDEPLEN